MRGRVNKGTRKLTIVQLRRMEKVGGKENTKNRNRGKEEGEEAKEKGERDGRKRTIRGGKERVSHAGYE